MRLSSTRVTEQPPDDAALALHRVEVAVPVAAADREAGDEMVEDEVVEDDDSGRSAQRLDDPAVRVRVVADVVDATSVPRGGPSAPRRTTVTSTAPGAPAAAARGSRRSPTARAASG